MDFEILAARINTKAWDILADHAVLADYARSTNAAIPEVHNALQQVLGDELQRDLPFWNSIIDQVNGGDSYARYLALRAEHLNIIDLVSTSCIPNLT
jgi:hypothetical protein